MPTTRFHVCAHCNQGVSIPNQCSRCSKYVHHMCAIELAREMASPEVARGREIVCSKACYEGSMPPPATAKKAPTTDKTSTPPGAVEPARPRSRGRPAGSKNKATAVSRSAAPEREAEGGHDEMASGAEGLALDELTPTSKAVHMQYVAFQALGIDSIVGNDDAELKKLYAPAGISWLRGVITGTWHHQVKQLDPSTHTLKTQLVTTHEVSWADAAFKSHRPIISMAKMLQGVRNYARLEARQQIRKTMSYVEMHAFDPNEQGAPFPDLEEYDSGDSDCEGDVPFYGDNIDYRKENAGKVNVDDWKYLSWDVDGSVEGPQDLYEHSDPQLKHDETYVLPAYRDCFSDPVTSFLAFLPLDFWATVTLESNQKARRLGAVHPQGFVAGRAFEKEITVAELMQFLGILLHMAIVTAGEYRTYWSKEQAASSYLRGDRTVANVMSLDRFKQIRAALCFTDETDPRDELWRLRPLLNVCQKSFEKYVVPGRDIAIDEARIPCRSSHARHIILKKPLGTYPIRLYTAACATSWFVLRFKIHIDTSSNDGDATSETSVGPSSNTETTSVVEDALPDDDSAAIGQPRGVVDHVVDLILPWQGSRRVLNVDNWHSSIALCHILRVQYGLYCRGTVRNPRFGFFQMRDVNTYPRGSSRFMVARALGVVAVSWIDGNVVHFLSTADGTTKSSEARPSTRTEQDCPDLVPKYTKYIKRVDRNDQMRKRVSIAREFSAKKWYQTLAFALVDMAITNAFILWMKMDHVARRDEHLPFCHRLAEQLMFEVNWDSLGGDVQIPHSDEPMTVEALNQGRKRKATPNATHVAAVEAVVPSPLPAASCSFVDSKHVFPTNADKRNCIVCTYERSTRKQKTVHCEVHQVNLCSIPQDINREAQPFECPNVDWPCWKKYHEFYLQHDVFQKTNGRQNKKSALYKLKASMVGPAAKKRKDDSQ